MGIIIAVVVIGGLISHSLVRMDVTADRLVAAVVAGLLHILNSK